MKKNRLFYLATSLNIGGTENFLVTLVNHLRGDFDITVGYLKDRGLLGEALRDRGVSVQPFTPWQLYRYLKAQRFDGIHTFLYRANIVGRIVGKMAGLPVISTSRAVDYWKRPYHTWLDRWTAPWCDLIITNSREGKAILRRRERIPGDKIKVIYNGIDLSRYNALESKDEVRRSLGIPQEAHLVICVTRLHPEKGTDYLPEIIRRGRRSHFLIVGDGPQRGMLEQSIRQWSLSDRTTVLGWRKDIPRLLAAADAFLLPSREESFPQAVLEAMACSLPVIASDVGGVRDLVEPEVTGVLAPSGDATAFAAAVNKFEKDREPAREMGRRGFEKSRLFSEQRMIDEVKELYGMLFKKD